MSRIRMRNQAGKLAIGTMASELYSPNLPRIFKVSGFDFCIVDCEHGPYDYTMVAAMIAASRELEIDVLVRVPGIVRACMLKYLDMGAAGLVIPMISSKEEMHEAVQIAKYAPLGERGISVTRAHSNYKIVNLPEYMTDTNSSSLVFAQIETSKGLKQVAEIASTEGLDGFFLGPGDLSVDLGIPGDNQHPRLLEAAEKIAVAAKKAGVLSGVISADFKLLHCGVALGMQMISWTSEVGMLLRSARQGLELLGKSQQ